MNIRKKFPTLLLCLLIPSCAPQPYGFSVKGMVDLGKAVPDEYVVTLKGDPGVGVSRLKGFFQARSDAVCGEGRIYRLRHWKEHTDPRPGGDLSTVTGQIECIAY